MKILATLRRLFESREQRAHRLRRDAQARQRAEKEEKKAKRKAHREAKLAKREAAIRTRATAKKNFLEKRVHNLSDRQAQTPVASRVPQPATAGAIQPGCQYYDNGIPAADCASCRVTVHPVEARSVKLAIMTGAFGVQIFKMTKTARWCSKCDQVYCGPCACDSSWSGPTLASTHTLGLPKWWQRSCPRCGTLFDVFTEESSND
jgi:hypothetical protein